MNRLAPLALIGLLFATFGCDKSAQAGTGEEGDPAPPVKITDLVEGEGHAAEEADLLILEYTGLFPDEDFAFETNAERDPETGEGLKPPYPVALGMSPVIDGWHEGLVGIKKGGERLLEIPWQKAYGEQGNPPTIPPKQNLNFKIKVLDIVPYGEEGFYDYDDIVVGTGRAVKDGDKITIHYRGTYLNGHRFDSSYERGDVEAGGTPTTFKVGADKVIQGIDVGVLGMQVGGKRSLWIPPKLAYGEGGYSVIQGNQILLFEIELLAIE